jgi:hypothetical protein
VLVFKPNVSFAEILGALILEPNVSIAEILLVLVFKPNASVAEILGSIDTCTTCLSCLWSKVCMLLNTGLPCDFNHMQKKKKFAQHVNADSFYNYLKSFDFIFISHLKKEIMGTTYLLCQVLQKQFQDVVNVMLLVHSTKALIQNLRENG